MNKTRRLGKRRGGAVLELILCLPILLIALFAIAEFAVLMANQQQLEYASRIGALTASETVTMPVDGAELSVSEIVGAVKRQLQQARIDTSDSNLRITLEHNVDGPTVTIVADDGLGGGPLSCPAPQLPSAPGSREYVRVTVCVDIIDGKMTPNLLKMYGFDIQGRIAQQTTTLRWEPGQKP